MKVVVLAGGTSTERDVSLSSGSMIYKALRKNGHQVMMLDVYLGYEGDITDIFEKDTDWAASRHRTWKQSKPCVRMGARAFSAPMYWLSVSRQMQYSWRFTEQTARMARFRHALN